MSESSAKLSVAENKLGDSHRVSNFQRCAQELGHKFLKDKTGLKPICKPTRLWTVDVAQRHVTDDDPWLTYLVALSSSMVVFVVNQPTIPEFLVVEIMNEENKAVARFLSRTEGTELAIRGLYLAKAQLLTSIPSHPKGVYLNKAYFSPKSAT